MVMVSHLHEFVFLKTRKTAGTSVEMLLEPLCREPGAVIEEKTPIRKSRYGIVGRRLTPARRFQRLRGTDWYNHMPAFEVRKALGEARWQGYRKVTCLRNPFDVAVSRYHWELARHDLPEAEDFAETRARFRDMAMSGRFDCEYKVVHLGKAFVPDFVIRFESLATDAAEVAGTLAPGYEPPPLPHTKKTSNRRARPIAEYYDADSIAAIRRSAGWVFDLLDYPEMPG